MVAHREDVSNASEGSSTFTYCPFLSISVTLNCHALASFFKIRSEANKVI